MLARQKPDVKTLCKVDQRAGIRVLLHKFRALRAACQIRIKHLDLALPAPKLIDVCDLDGLSPFLCRDVAEVASARTSSARHADRKVKLRIDRVIREHAFHVVGQGIV